MAKESIFLVCFSEIKYLDKMDFFLASVNCIDKCRTGRLRNRHMATAYRTRIFTQL